MTTGAMCPRCRGVFMAAWLDDCDDEDDDRGLVTCPICRCSFDPWAPRPGEQHGVDPVSLDDLVDHDDE